MSWLGGQASWCVATALGACMGKVAPCGDCVYNIVYRKKYLHVSIKKLKLEYTVIFCIKNIPVQKVP